MQLFQPIKIVSKYILPTGSIDFSFLKNKDYGRYNILTHSLLLKILMSFYLNSPKLLSLTHLTQTLFFPLKR